MLTVCYILMFAAPYLICGINSAIIVTGLRTGQDIRTIGSGNAGLTNTLRTQGKFAALLVLLGDVLKGVVSVFAVRLAFFILAGIDTSLIENGLNCVAYAAGVAAILGHVYPVYYGFKGGKGVLVTLAVLYSADWLSATILFGIFLVIVAVTRYVSLGSVIAGFLYPFCILVLGFLNGDPSVWLNSLCAAMIAFIIIFMHRENIERLKSGTEKKLFQKTSETVQEKTAEEEAFETADSNKL